MIENYEMIWLEAYLWMNVYVVAKSNRVVVEEKIYLYCCYLYRKSGLQIRTPD